MDLIVLGGFFWGRLNTDPSVFGVAVATTIVVVIVAPVCRICQRAGYPG
ncbi:MAG: hypothetical protein KBT73_15570 [Marinobacter sp.]|nr:hypothetical protein [Marinobacter sp.]